MKALPGVRGFVIQKEHVIGQKELYLLLHSWMDTYTGEFDIPWFYERFRCKGGACRHTCCQGLSVTISQEEYFRLAGIACSSSLRSELDVALDPLKDADPYRYAALMPNFFGHCRLLDGRGLCRLQEECGLAALPAGCRYFPRSPRFCGRGQCSVSNACEETLELLYNSDQSWKEKTKELRFDLNGPFPTDTSAEAERRLRAHRKAVQTMVREDLPLEERIVRLRDVCLDAAAQEQESPTVYGKENAQACPGTTFSRLLLQRLLQELGDTYESLRPFCEMAIVDMLKTGAAQADAEETDTTTEDKKGLWSWLTHRLIPVRAHFPSFDHFVSMVLTNDLFYRFFPYTERGIQPVQSFTAWAWMTFMLLGLCGSCLNESSTKEELIDLFAAFFRMVELTPFDRNCLVILAQKVPAFA